MTVWRRMTHADVMAVKAMSDAVHGAYTEDAAIYVDRLRLYPAGCWMLDRQGVLLGYLVSHPWRGDVPPRLNIPLTTLPVSADRYYLHDLALLPQARGTGAAGQGVRLALEAGRGAGFDRIMLTAVNGADAFWRKQGFTPMAAQEAAYGEGSLLMERALV